MNKKKLAYSQYLPVASETSQEVVTKWWRFFKKSDEVPDYRWGQTLHQ